MTEVQVDEGVAMGRSIRTYKIGGREYPEGGDRRCKVCRSPHRQDIELELVAGRTYRKIHESLPEDSDLLLDNIKRHYLNGHLPVAQAQQRAIVEHRAQRVGKSIEASNESLIDGITLLETAVQKVYEGIASGEIQPTVRDGIRAAKMLADLGEYDQGGMDQDAMVEAFMVYHETASDMMSPEQFEQFGQVLEESPVLRALAARYERQGDTVEGEVKGRSDEALAGSLDNG